MQIQDGETTIAEKFVKVNAAQSGNEKATAVAEIELPEARLWDEESPNLYLAKIILEEDEKYWIQQKRGLVSVSFPGVRRDFL